MHSNALSIAALDTACPSVKKQVVELLSALCVYSQDGRQRAIDTLHTYQVRPSNVAINARMSRVEERAIFILGFGAFNLTDVTRTSRP